MRKISKVVALGLVATMTTGLLLTGCGNGSKSSDGGKDAKGKIVIFQSKTEIMDPLNELAEEYSDETGVEVEVWESTGDSYVSDIKTKLSSGQGPTIFSLQPGAETEEMKNYLEDLSDLSFVDKIADGFASEVDGKVVGIPYTVEGFGLVYNKDLVTPDKVDTTDKLVDFMKESKTNDIAGVKLSQEGYFLIGHILNTPFAVQENPDDYLAKVLSGEVKIKDSSAFQDFAKLMVAIRENSDNPLEVTYDQNCGDFATGKTAMIHQGNWVYSMFADYDVNFDMSLAAVPVDGNQKLSVSVPAAWFINNEAADEDKAAAKDFLNWLYTSEKGTDYLMNKFGFIPVVDGMTSEKLDPISQAVADSVASGNTIPWVMSNWPAGIVDAYLAPVAQEFFTSEMTADEFLDKLNDAFTTAAE